VCKYFICFLSLAAAFVFANDTTLRDPTRPIGAATSQVVVSQSSPLQLNSVLISPSRKVATINGQSLMQGQTIKGTDYQVVSIQKNAVTLKSGNTTRVLTMIESRVKK
jgi:kynureninase